MLLLTVVYRFRVGFRGFVFSVTCVSSDGWILWILEGVVTDWEFC